MDSSKLVSPEIRNLLLAILARGTCYVSQNVDFSGAGHTWRGLKYRSLPPLDGAIQRVLRRLRRGNATPKQLVEVAERERKTIQNWSAEGGPLYQCGMRRASRGVFTWPNPDKSICSTDRGVSCTLESTGQLLQLVALELYSVGIHTVGS